MIPRVWINSTTFSDGTTLEFEESDVVVFVGPNNAGKSASLRDIKSKLERSGAESVVVKNLNFLSRGTRDELHDWFRKNFTSELNIFDPDNLMYKGLNATTGANVVERVWKGYGSELESLSNFFCCHITADARLQVANPVPSINLLENPLEHPIHYLHKYPDMEAAASAYFKQAFNQSLLVHRNAGNNVPLYVTNGAS